MRTTAIAWANVRSLWRRLFGLIALIAISAAVCLSALAISHRAETAAHQRVQEGTGNRSLQLDRLGDRPDAHLLDAASLSAIATLPGVQSVEPRAQVSFGYKDRTVPGVLLYATTPRPSLLPPVSAGIRPNLFPLRAHEIVLPRTADTSDLSGLLGHTIHVQVTRATALNQGTGLDQTVTVAGLFDPSWQIDGPNVAYAEPQQVLTWAALRAGVPTADYAQTVGYDRVSVVAASSADVDRLLAQLQRQGFAASTLRQQLQALPGVLSLIRSAGSFLLAVLVLIAALSAYLVTSSLARQRTREVGILKAVGFQDRRIFGLLFTESVIAAVLSAVVGLLLGIAAASLGNGALRSQAQLEDFLAPGLVLPSATVTALLLPTVIAVVAVGALLPALRAARMQPADAIREW